MIAEWRRQLMAWMTADLALGVAMVVCLVQVMVEKSMTEQTVLKILGNNMAIAQFLAYKGVQLLADGADRLFEVPIIRNLYSGVLLVLKVLFVALILVARLVVSPPACRVLVFLGLIPGVAARYLHIALFGTRLQPVPAWMRTAGPGMRVCVVAALIFVTLAGVLLAGAHAFPDQMQWLLGNLMSPVDLVLWLGFACAAAALVSALQLESSPARATPEREARSLRDMLVVTGLTSVIAAALVPPIIDPAGHARTRVELAEDAWIAHVSLHRTLFE